MAGGENVVDTSGGSEVLVVQKGIEELAIHRKQFLVSVAIDFGTTYSGYAFSTNADFKRDPTRISANSVWTATGNRTMLSMKTPTCLLLSPNKTFLAFGYEAEELYANLMEEDDDYREYYFFKKFKMKLFSDKVCDVLKDATGKPLPSLTVFSESIAFFKNHFLEEIRLQGNGVIGKEEIRWVLTVPAIWNDFAKTFMRKAAILAGIPGENLVLAFEPEAASLWCQHIFSEKTADGIGVAREGTKFMVLDLGGGTADITAQEKLEDGNLREICRATGGPFGGTAVDSGFIHFLITAFGRRVIHTLKKNYLNEFISIMRDFEVVKRSLTSTVQCGDSSATFCTLKIPAELDEICRHDRHMSISETLKRNAEIADIVQLKKDKIRIRKDHVEEMITCVLDGVCRKVEDILQTPEGREITLIQLVGGFAESRYVQEIMNEKFQKEGRYVVVPPEPGLAVLKGAVIFGHSPTSIESRIMRYSYGNAAKRPFIEGEDDEMHKDDDGTTVWCRNLFRPFMRANTSVRRGEQVVVKKKTTHYDTARMKIYVTEKGETKYVTDAGCRELCNVLMHEVLPGDVAKKQRIKQIITFGETELKIKLINMTEKSSGFLSVDIEPK